MVIFKARMTIGMTSMHIYPFPSCVFQTNLFSECNLHSQSSKRSVAVCFRFGQKMFRLGFEWKGFHMKTCNGDDDEVLIRKCFLYMVVFSHIRPDRSAVATPNHWLEGRHHHVHNQHSLFHTNMTMIIMIISKSPQWSSWTEQPFTPYSWLVEQRPGGQTIFLKITEVLPKIFLAFQDKWNTAKLISSRSPRFYSFRIRM